MTIERFVVGQRVRVCDPRGEFDGFAGTVARVRSSGSDAWAWVALDQWPAHAPRAFLVDDRRGRGNWLMVCGGECELESEAGDRMVA